MRGRRFTVKSIRILLRWIVLVAVAADAAACSPKAGPASPTASAASAPRAPTTVAFADPFAYCAAVGTVDTPDARYSGPAVPDVIINGFKKAAGLEASTEPIEMFRKTTIWRCMDGKVYACNFGANLPCDSKGNTDRTPSKAMEDYCFANPDSDVIPMSVTGHDTVYSWRCAKESPQLLEQIAQLDAAGYLAQIWYELEPGP